MKADPRISIKDIPGFPCPNGAATVSARHAAATSLRLVKPMNPITQGSPADGTTLGSMP